MVQFDATGDASSEGGSVVVGVVNETSGGDARCWMPYGDTSGGCFSSAEVNVTADSFDDSVSVEEKWLLSS